MRKNSSLMSVNLGKHGDLKHENDVVASMPNHHVFHGSSMPQHYDLSWKPITRIKSIISSLTLSSLYLLVLLMCCKWIVVVVMNTKRCGKMQMGSNMIAVFIIIVQIFGEVGAQIRWIDIGQVGKYYSHLVSDYESFGGPKVPLLGRNDPGGS